MKTIEEIMAARAALVMHVIRRDISEEQRSIFMGMSGALRWVCGESDLEDDIIRWKPTLVDKKKE
jgi:hypothetical protein